MGVFRRSRSSSRHRNRIRPRPEQRGSNDEKSKSIFFGGDDWSGPLAFAHRASGNGWREQSCGGHQRSALVQFGGLQRRRMHNELPAHGALVGIKALYYPLAGG